MPSCMTRPARRRSRSDRRVASALRATYQDAAPPFDPLTQGPAPLDPEQPLSEQRVGGIGLLLIRQLGSAITYEYRDGRNRLVFTI